ncbi:THxN family PEP-CTERM protein [Anabaena sp. CCY 9402-a]|uniref:THxN family PEP-CTERM protein n=1 Tax=Anabaena sp. CCY 9402-a TaxID=3103867 RepID=UPI0039C5AFC1
MNKTLSFFGVATAVTMSLASAGMAQAISIETSGVWTSVTPDGTTTVNGINTNTVSWGDPATNSGQSSYVFNGENTFTAPIDGTDFLLGTFTHNNFPVFPPSITGANLALSLSGDVNKTFNFFFNHNETPNNGDSGVCSSTPGFNVPCPDVVSIPNTASSETINIGGHQYILAISGFLQGGSVVNQFITQEDQANTAEIFGRLEKVPVEEVPEPLTMLGITTGVAFGGFFKRKYSKSQKSKVSA